MVVKIATEATHMYLGKDENIFPPKYHHSLLTLENLPLKNNQPLSDWN